MTSLWYLCQASPVPSSNNLQCVFPNDVLRERYERTKQNFYPYQHAFGIEAFNETESMPSWLISSYDEEQQVTVCPENQSPRPWRASPMSDSVCPWYYENDYKPNRFPAIVSRAVCSCRECLNPTTSNVDPSYTCKEIKYKIQVLEKVDCIEGLFRYNLTTLDVPVACACLRNPM